MRLTCIASLSGKQTLSPRDRRSRNRFRLLAMSAARSIATNPRRFCGTKWKSLPPSYPTPCSETRFRAESHSSPFSIACCLLRFRRRIILEQLRHSLGDVLWPCFGIDVRGVPPHQLLCGCVIHVDGDLTGLDREHVGALKF